MIALIVSLIAVHSIDASRPAPAASAPSAAGAVPAVRCPPDADEVQRLLSLPQSDFDQNPRSGWRLYASNRCYSDAAALIAGYIAHRNPGLGALSLLRFHQFQMLAYAGDTCGALAVLEEVERIDAARNADAGWRLYVAGTRAFLENRREELEAHAAALIAFADRRGPTERAARLNANVLQGLVRCFGRPYAAAYGPPCADREAARRITMRE